MRFLKNINTDLSWSSFDLINFSNLCSQSKIKRLGSNNTNVVMFKIAWNIEDIPVALFRYILVSAWPSSSIVIFENNIVSFNGFCLGTFCGVISKCLAPSRFHYFIDFRSIKQYIFLGYLIIIWIVLNLKIILKTFLSGFKIYILKSR